MRGQKIIFVYETRFAPNFVSTYSWAKKGVPNFKKYKKSGKSYSIIAAMTDSEVMMIAHSLSQTLDNYLVRKESEGWRTQVLDPTSGNNVYRVGLVVRAQLLWALTHVGFDADDEVSLVLQGQSGAIVSPGANVTFLVEGRSPAVFIDGAITEAASRGPGSVTVRVPLGTHRIDIDGS